MSKVIDTKIITCEKCFKIPKIRIHSYNEIEVECINCQKKIYPIDDNFFKDKINLNEFQCNFLEDNCSNASKIFCIECSKYICNNEKCKKMHDNSARTQHTFIDQRISSEFFCKKHQDFKITSYCTKCNEHLCDRCSCRHPINSNMKLISANGPFYSFYESKDDSDKLVNEIENKIKKIKEILITEKENKNNFIKLIQKKLEILESWFKNYEERNSNLVKFYEILINNYKNLKNINNYHIVNNIVINNNFDLREAKDTLNSYSDNNLIHQYKNYLNFFVNQNHIIPMNNIQFNKLINLEHYHIKKSILINKNKNNILIFICDNDPNFYRLIINDEDSVSIAQFSGTPKNINNYEEKDKIMNDICYLNNEYFITCNNKNIVKWQIKDNFSIPYINCYETNDTKFIVSDFSESYYYVKNKQNNISIFHNHEKIFDESIQLIFSNKEYEKWFAKLYDIIQKFEDNNIIIITTPKDTINNNSNNQSNDKIIQENNPINLLLNIANKYKTTDEKIDISKICLDCFQLCELYLFSLLSTGFNDIQSLKSLFLEKFPENSKYKPITNNSLMMHIVLKYLKKLSSNKNEIELNLSYIIKEIQKNNVIKRSFYIFYIFYGLKNIYNYNNKYLLFTGNNYAIVAFDILKSEFMFNTSIILLNDTYKTFDYKNCDIITIIQNKIIYGNFDECICYIINVDDMIIEYNFSFQDRIIYSNNYIIFNYFNEQSLNYTQMNIADFQINELFNVHNITSDKESENIKCIINQNDKIFITNSSYIKIFTFKSKIINENKNICIWAKEKVKCIEHSKLKGENYKVEYLLKDKDCDNSSYYCSLKFDKPYLIFDIGYDNIKLIKFRYLNHSKHLSDAPKTFTLYYMTNNNKFEKIKDYEGGNFSYWQYFDVYQKGKVFKIEFKENFEGSYIALDKIEFLIEGESSNIKIKDENK